MPAAYLNIWTLLFGLFRIILNLQCHSMDPEPMEAPTKTCKPSILRLSWLFGLDQLLYLHTVSRQCLLASHGRHDNMRRSYRLLLTQLPNTEVMYRHDSWYLAQFSDDGFAVSARWCASKQDVSASKSCICQPPAAQRK
jgi:hypothetical protein